MHNQIAEWGDVLSVVWLPMINPSIGFYRNRIKVWIITARFIKHDVVQIALNMYV
jgi:hypothetical protein